MGQGVKRKSWKCVSRSNGCPIPAARGEGGKNSDLIFAFIAKRVFRSFPNISCKENEPMVSTPEEAIDCVRRTPLDVWVTGLR